MVEYPVFLMFVDVGYTSFPLAHCVAVQVDIKITREH